ncbi:MAG: hypothetical protein M1497_07000 [Nitrospirae bacterium]|nr:hypothetical protein [Nitrospirota bacterium]
MKRMFRWTLLITVFFSSYFILPAAESAEPLKITGSSQFLWGDDWLGDSQSILAQYLRVSYNPQGERYSITGYGRIWKGFGDTTIRDNDFLGRLYYLFLDYRPSDKTSLRLGRQYVNLSAGSALLDGLTLNAHSVGPVGITAAVGREIKYSLDAEYSSFSSTFWGIDVHLENVRSLQLGASYVRRYDEWMRAREEVGVNFRYFYKFLSPYAEARYDILSKATDEATVGIDVFPMSNLMLKAEFYQSYPTFFSTSIYSVFAVDRYREYLVRADYSLDQLPVTVYASYAKQSYEEEANTDNYILGARVFPIKNLVVNASVDYRTGYGGNLWGFEIYGNYKINNKFVVAAGIQYDAYRRPDNDNNGNAQRYWLGGQWVVNKNVSVDARIEDNVNENFDHRPLGRVAVNWTI